MQIGKAIQGAMNDQIHKELESAYLYLAMSAYFSGTNHPGAASWMRAQAREEVGHAMKFTDFVEDRGGSIALRALAAPPATFASPLAAFEAAAEHEAVVSASINALFELASKEKDYADPGAAAVVHHRAGGGGEDQPADRGHAPADRHQHLRPLHVRPRAGPPRTGRLTPDPLQRRTSLMRIAFLGLGAIGTPMAVHVAKQHQLTVWNRTGTRATAFAAAHACAVAATPREAAAGAEVIITCLPTSS